jgi:hypothetical protein
MLYTERLNKIDGLEILKDNPAANKVPLQVWLDCNNQL